MNTPEELPLMLGGHSFVQQLGNDPIPDPGAAVEVVAACLDAGIRWFDTTFRPERIALGAALARHTNPAVRAPILEALASIGGTEAIKHLLPFLGSGGAAR